MQTDPRVDAYIAKSAEFARPMLARLREMAHGICPEAEESIKWGAPALVWKGKNLCGFAAFKAHAVCFVQGEGKSDDTAGMGSFGKMRSMGDLPTRAALAKALKARMNVISDGAPKKPAKPPPEVPPDLAETLKASKPAAATFAALSPFNQRDYVTWITGAKQDATRALRIQQAVALLAEGKARNWKYVKK